MGAVDVHWKITPRSFRFAPDEEAFWRRARAVDLEFGAVMAIAPEDLLLYLCVHAAKHGWIALGSICDVAETIRGRPEIDLMAILDEATTLGSRRMFLTGIYLAHELVGAPVPEDVVAIARDDPPCAHWQRASRTNYSAAPRRDARISIRGRFRSARSRARARGCVTSSDGCWRRRWATTNSSRCPARCSRSTGSIRPFRMALQYGPRLLRGSSSASHA